MMKDMSKYIADLQEQLKAQRDNTGTATTTATTCNQNLNTLKYNTRS